MPAGRPYLDRDGRPEISWPEMVEGVARRVTDAATLKGAAAHLFELVPVMVFGFGTDESLNAMRWSFGRR